MLDTMGTAMRRRKKRIDMKKIAERNPRVDLKKVRQAQDLMKDLDRRDGDAANYNLVSPFDRRFSQERLARHELALDLSSKH